MFITVDKYRRVNENVISEVRCDVTHKTLCFTLTTGEVIKHSYTSTEELEQAYTLFNAESDGVSYAIDRLVFGLEDIKDYGIGVDI